MRPTRNQSIRWTLWAGALVALALLATGCGGDEGSERNDVDVAFVEAMIPHHAMAVQSAQYQYENGDDRKLRKFARDVVNVQVAEIAELDRIGERIGADVDPAHTAPLNHQNMAKPHGDASPQTLDALKELGLTVEQAGMAGAMHQMTDEEFAQAMIPHHEGAVRMARVELEEGKNADLRKIARNVISAQTREIGELRELSQ
jgi:uncharacterized protein (DUF305 family)